MVRWEGARHTAPIVEVFKQRFANPFNTLAEGGRTPALWVQYHWMVDVIRSSSKVNGLTHTHTHTCVGVCVCVCECVCVLSKKKVK